MNKFKRVIVISLIYLFFLVACVSNSFEWHIEALKLNDTWNKTKGIGQTIAFIDTGLSENFIEMNKNRIVFPYNVITNNSDITDKNGHGTEMISVACGKGEFGVYGVAPEAKIMPIVAVDSNGHATPENLADGILWAVKKGATVINLSLGNELQNDIVTEAIQEAIKKNIIIVASAGDYSQSALLYPAALASVISVQCQDLDGEIMLMSNYTENKASIGAPGKDILALSIDENKELVTKRITGTSVSTAIISGLVALARSKNEKLTSDELLELMLDSVNRKKIINSEKLIKLINLTVI